jgi:hypothetical protein
MDYKNLVYYSNPIQPNESNPEVFEHFGLFEQKPLQVVGSIKVESKIIDSSASPGKKQNLCNVVLKYFQDNESCTFTYTFFSELKAKDQNAETMAFLKRVMFLEQVAAWGDILVQIDSLADTTWEGDRGGGKFWSCKVKTFMVIEPTPQLVEMAALRDEMLALRDEMVTLHKSTNTPTAVAQSVSVPVAPKTPVRTVRPRVITIDEDDTPF